MTTYCVKAKCMGCDLHFAAYSWNEDWRPRACPECLARKFLIWQVELPKEIFEYVPGGASLVAMS